MASIYESYGRLQERLDQECESHHSTISVIERLQRGEIGLDQVVIIHNTNGTTSWQIVPPRPLGPETKDEPAKAPE